MLHGNAVRNIAKQLRTHFIEKLGWDTRNVEFTTVVKYNIEEKDEKIFSIAEKRGFCVYLSRIDKDKQQITLHKGLRRITHEHITLFVNKHYWLWQYQESPSDKYYRNIVPPGFVPNIKFLLENEGNTYITDVCKEIDKVFKMDGYEDSFHEAIEIGEK